MVSGESGESIMTTSSETGTLTETFMGTKYRYYTNMGSLRFITFVISPIVKPLHT